MNSNFQENLKTLTTKYSQKQVAEKTGFSQSSINNYLTKNSEPSIAFLVALKDAFNINIEDFLFSSYEEIEQTSLQQFIGNYLIYYYNNDSYNGEVHTNLKNTLNYGVLSIYKEKSVDNLVHVVATFTKEKTFAIKLLKELNSNLLPPVNLYKEYGNVYFGKISLTEQNIFLDLENKENGDKSFIILNNPPTKQNYIGGAGTVNSIARGREHNPCVQFLIMSKKLIDVPDGELYNLLKFDNYSVNMEDSIKDIIDLFKRLYAENNEISLELTDTQKQAIIKNNLEYHFNEILQANAFRFAKVSNKDDDAIYKLIKGGIDV